MRAMSYFTEYNTKATVITAVSLALLSLVGVVIILLITMPSRASLPSLIVTVLLSFALLLGIIATACGRTGGDRSAKMAKECSCIWATCEFSALSTQPLQYRHMQITNKEGTVKWLSTTEVSGTDIAISTAEMEKTCPCCLDDFQPDSQVAILPCRHVFHERCIARWSMASAKKGALCPKCRERFNSPSEPEVLASQLGVSSV